MAQGRRFRLSLRMFMVLVLVLGTGLGYVILRARDQQLAVEAIRRLGGSVYYDYQWTNHSPIPSNKSPWPEWLLVYLGDDYFHGVKGISLGGGPSGQPDNSLMERIGRLGSLEWLHLNSCPQITDQGLVHLRGLTQLNELDLSFTGATGAALANVSDLRQLKELELSSLPVTDADLAHLSGLTSLEWLQFTSPGITDAGSSTCAGF